MKYSFACVTLMVTMIYCLGTIEPACEISTSSPLLPAGYKIRRESTADTVPEISTYTFPLPGDVKHVIIDIGLYNTIIRPRAGEFVIAIDASLKEIEANKLSTMCATTNCILLNTAIGEGPNPFVDLHQSERPGGSAHITNFDPNVWPMELRPAVVPLNSLKTIIDAIPQELPIILCKLDTNGNDVDVLDSAGTSLKRCLRVVMEIVGPQDGTGPPDQYERAIAITKKHGFRLDPLYPSAKQQSGSYDLNFERPEARHQPDTSELYHNIDRKSVV